LNPLLKPKGFTLLAVSVALIILSFALLALEGLMVSTTNNNAFGNYVTEAATFAQDKLEELRAVKCENLVEVNNTD
jgi:Tfp pilus assembly protein PilV